MSKRFRKIILAITLVLIVGLWVRFWLKIPPANFEIGADPLVSVNYYPSHPSDKSPEDLAKENDFHIADSSRVLSDYNPDIGNFYISSSSRLANFADYNLSWASDLRHFSPNITTIDTRDKTAKDLLNAFTDPDFQQFVQLNPEQTYDLYISFDGTVFSPAEIVINDKVYLAHKINDKYFKIMGFESGNHKFFGIKPTDKSKKINQAAFITKRIKSEDPITRINFLEKGMLSASRNQIEVNIPDNNFLFLKSPNNLYLTSDQLGKNREIFGFFYQSNSWANKQMATLNLNQPMLFGVLSHSGFYTTVDPKSDPRKIKYAFVSGFLLLIGVAVSYDRWLFSFFLKIPIIVAAFWQRFQLAVKQDQAEIIIYLSILFLLLIFRINPLIESYLTIPVFLAIISLIIVSYSRFNIRLITVMILFFTSIIIIFCQSDYTSWQESLEYIIFFLLLIAAITLIFSSEKIKSKKS
ncbi:MAG: hypothetical protein COV00_01620 [Candidatus Tagabacteria bacterium CG10_big_fil_rev_8_21_14_0_10_40_13]|uniref:Uncharacterized protein n=1 Tax=Candidatus Tagabacteria bacterium CG10_big_fil_rev_8_21_14_0_10_40_13 TaxID=1975022 RepID=A0A2M8L914_9BACT|nr:MAG: hypothetical protein COV00_01620 [Candidatus Tagabacteria bacterium CG10_big_fil_rev_8_21_14_0_10_40_13]